MQMRRQHRSAEGRGYTLGPGGRGEGTVGERRGGGEGEGGSGDGIGGGEEEGKEGEEEEEEGG